MSFPNRYGSSPALPRDYGLVQSTSYKSNHTAPIDEEDCEDDDDDGDDAAAADTDADTSLPPPPSEDDHDNMSHLSISFEDGHDQDLTSTPRPRRTAAAAAAAAVADNTATANASANKRRSVSGARPPSAPASPEQHPAPGGSSFYGRIGRITGDVVPGSHFDRRTSGHFSSATAADDSGHHILSTSFLLGGEPMEPPPGADMRSEEEAIKDGDGDQWEDNDATPMPNRFQSHDEWLARPPLTRQQLERHQRNIAAGEADEAAAAAAAAAATPSVANSGNTAADEQTPLLSRISRHAGAGGAAAAHADRRVSQYTIASLPPLPGPEQLQELQDESATIAGIEEHDASAARAAIRKREYWVLTKYSLPVWGTHLLELSLNVVSVFSIGHLGTTQLAAASLSSMTANVTAFSLLSGFISALDSLLPPAFTQQPKRVGVYTQSMSIIVALLLIPIALVWLNAEKILLLLGQEAEVAHLSGLYLRVMLPGVPAYAGFEVCRRYLQAQGLMSASTMVLFVVSPLNAFLNWLLVWGPDSVRLGFVGAPVASAISNWLMFFLCLGQCYIAPRTAWGGLSPASAIKGANLWPCLQLGLFGFMAISSEWWAWEISSLITSLLGTAPLAAQSVLLVCSSITYQQPFAISVAVAVRVGNLLGALKPWDAKIASNVGVVLSLASGVLNSSAVLLFRRQIASAFSEDPAVVSLLTETLPLLALFQVADGIAGVTGGILRGTGRQHLGAYLNMVAYYVIALPLGAWLTFTFGMGLPGMWVGLTVALAISSAGGMWLCGRTDWEKEVDKVQARMDDGYMASVAGPASVPATTSVPPASSAAGSPTALRANTVSLPAAHRDLPAQPADGWSEEVERKRAEAAAAAEAAAQAAADAEAAEMAAAASGKGQEGLDTGAIGSDAGDAHPSATQDDEMRLHNLDRAKDALELGVAYSPPLRLANIRLAASPSVRPSFLARFCRPYVDPECRTSPLQRFLHSSSGRLSFDVPGSPTTLPGIMHLTSHLASNLQKFDVYSGIEASLMPSLEPTSPDTADEDVDVLLQLKEAPRFFLKSSTDVGNGEGSVSLQGRIRNVFGGAEKLEGSYEMGTRTRVGLNALFSTPVLASPDHVFSLAAYMADRDKSFYASCFESAKGLRAALTANASPTAQHELAWELSWRHVGRLSPGASVSMRKLAGHSVKSALSHTYTRDTRVSLAAAREEDRVAAAALGAILEEEEEEQQQQQQQQGPSDVQDLTARGSFAKSTAELAARALGGEASFLKWEGEWSTGRRPLAGALALGFPFWGRGTAATSTRTPTRTPTPALSYSFSARAGLLRALSAGHGHGHGHAPAVPFGDRFHLGGPTCVRMFKANALGPKDGRDSLGGTAFYALGLSVFAPIPRKEHWPVRVQGFVNAGQLTAGEGAGGSVSSRPSASPSPSSSSSSGSAHSSKTPSLRGLASSLSRAIDAPSLLRPSTSAGLGLMYEQGPLRVELNFGMPLSARGGDGMRKGVQVGVGVRFLG